MTIDNCIAGLTILKKYAKGYCLSAAHEELHVWLEEGTVISPEDIEALNELGWCLNTRDGSYYGFI